MNHHSPPARCESRSEARLDSIFAQVRRFSRETVQEKLLTISMLLESEAEADVLKAVAEMESLAERFRAFGNRARGATYVQARSDLFVAWRWVMRGEYGRARMAVDCALTVSRDMP
jgi:hypothetical protein